VQPNSDELGTSVSSPTSETVASKAQTK
jgi:hypothetical protein